MPKNLQRRCAVCHVEIHEPRATVVPKSRLCIDHAHEIDKYGGEFIRVVRRASLGKAGSLKKNYGDVTMQLIRNYLALNLLKEDYEEQAQKMFVEAH